MCYLLKIDMVSFKNESFALLRLLNVLMYSLSPSSPLCFKNVTLRGINKIDVLGSGDSRPIAILLLR